MVKTDTCTCTSRNCLGYHRGEGYEERIERLINAPKPKGHGDGAPRTCQACREDLHMGLSCSDARVQAELLREYEEAARYPTPTQAEVEEWDREFALTRLTALQHAQAHRIA